MFTTVKWSNWSISKNSIQHKSFVCTRFKCQIVLFDPLIGPHQVLPLRLGMDLGAMTKKGYSAFCKAPRLEPHHQIVYCHIQDPYWGVFHLCRDAVSVFYSPSWLGWPCFEFYLTQERSVQIQMNPDFLRGFSWHLTLLPSPVKCWFSVLVWFGLVY